MNEQEVFAFGMNVCGTNWLFLDGAEFKRSAWSVKMSSDLWMSYYQTGENTHKLLHETSRP